MRGSDTMPVLNDLGDLIGGKSLFFLQAEDLNLVVFIFEDLQFFHVIEQVHTLATINFEHGHVEVGIRILLIADVEDVVDGVFGYGIDGESFS